MSISYFYLCAVPEPIWSQPATTHGYRADIARFVADALGCERRIAKEVNLENEYNRYTLCCQRLEQEIVLSGRVKFISDISQFRPMLQAGRFPALSLHPDYLSLLSQTVGQAEWDRLGASFFTPEQINRHIAAFELWTRQQGLSEWPAVIQRLAFLYASKQSKCGLVEIQTNFHQPQSHTSVQMIIAQPDTDKEECQFVDIPDFATGGLEVEFFGAKGRKAHLGRVLRKQILAALQSGDPVTFGNQAPHDVIAEVLNEFVFVPAGEPLQPVKMRVAYADGSEAAPFPLFCLPRPSEDTLTVLGAPLRVALMSMRHLELDPEIDFCWFRNRDVSRTRTLAETDQFCLNATLEQLRNSLELGRLLIHLYHTGFEPAVLGFYRGVVQTLLNNNQPDLVNLAVVPYYYRGRDGYQRGTTWH